MSVFITFMITDGCWRQEKRNFKALATATAAAASLARGPGTLGVPSANEASGKRLSQVLVPQA